MIVRPFWSRTIHQQEEEPPYVARMTLFQPPALIQTPTYIDITKPTQKIGVLDLKKDYIVRCHVPITGASGTRYAAEVNGGRMIHIIGCEVDPVTNANGFYFHNMADGGELAFVGVLMKGNPIHGDGFRGALSSGTTFIMEDVRIDRLHGEYKTSSGKMGVHADGLQIWWGDAKTKVFLNRVTIHSDYQGVFFQPAQFGPGGMVVHAQKVNMEHTGAPAKGGAGLFAGNDFTLPDPSDLYATGPNTTGLVLGPWKGHVTIGTPPGGDFCPVGVAGLGYPH